MRVTSKLDNASHPVFLLLYYYMYNEKGVL